MGFNLKKLPKIDLSDEQSDLVELYVETFASNGEAVPPNTQKSGCIFESTVLRIATKREISGCKEYFTTHGKCKYHLVKDEPAFWYDYRYCAVCKKIITLV